jgi:hypothetical protein
VSNLLADHDDPALHELITGVGKSLADSLLVSQRILDTNLNHDVGRALDKIINFTDKHVTAELMESAKEAQTDLAKTIDATVQKNAEFHEKMDSMSKPSAEAMACRQAQDRFLGCLKYVAPLLQRTLLPDDSPGPTEVVVFANIFQNHENSEQLSRFLFTAPPTLEAGSTSLICIWTALVPRLVVGLRSLVTDLQNNLAQRRDLYILVRLWNDVRAFQLSPEKPLEQQLADISFRKADVDFILQWGESSSKELEDRLLEVCPLCSYLVEKHLTLSGQGRPGFELQVADFQVLIAFGHLIHVVFEAQKLCLPSGTGDSVADILEGGRDRIQSVLSAIDRFGVEMKTMIELASFTTDVSAQWQAKVEILMRANVHVILYAKSHGSLLKLSCGTLKATLADFATAVGWPAQTLQAIRSAYKDPTGIRLFTQAHELKVLREKVTVIWEAASLDCKRVWAADYSEVEEVYIQGTKVVALFSLAQASVRKLKDDEKRSAVVNTIMKNVQQDGYWDSVPEAVQAEIMALTKSDSK